MGGGLGNQLFQYAAGWKIAQNQKLTLDNTRGLARKSADHQIDIGEFDLPDNVSILTQINNSKITLKFVKLSLRESAKGNLKTILLLEGIASFVYALKRKSSCKYFINNGIGLDCRIKGINNRSTLVGYFQTAEIPETSGVKEILLDLKLKNYSMGLIDKIDEAKRIKPTFVHVRLTDYKFDSRFGITSEKYYEKALSLLDSSGKTKTEIWLFSDSPEEAKNLIPQKYHPRMRIHLDDGLSSAESLELMRYGGAYVIANSTFSWWAAFLRKNQLVPVIAPSPWFSGMPDPIQICPSTWTRISTF